MRDTPASTPDFLVNARADALARTARARPRNSVVERREPFDVTLRARDDDEVVV